ncbi:MAG: DUF3100 domain-containing protein [Brevinema sp.]
MKKFYLWFIALIIVSIAELIGAKSIVIGNLSITLLPMLYAVIFGFLVAPELLGRFVPFFNSLFDKPIIEWTGKLSGYSILVLGVRLGFNVGPNIGEIFSVGPAFIAQEFGHFFSPIIAMPIALWLGLKREAIGATASVSREGAVGIITERYGMNSPEGTGVLGVYIIGSIFGTIIFSLIGNLAIYTGLHPYALAMACGVGSASMMTAAISSLLTTIPEHMRDLALSYASTSNLISTGVTGIYLLLWGTLPFTNWYYDKLAPIFNKNKE